MARLTTSIDSIATKSSLPPLDVVKFSGNPCEYFRFKSRFEEIVDTPEHFRSSENVAFVAVS